MYVVNIYTDMCSICICIYLCICKYTHKSIHTWAQNQRLANPMGWISIQLSFCLRFQPSSRLFVWLLGHQQYRNASLSSSIAGDSLQVPDRRVAAVVLTRFLLSCLLGSALSQAAGSWAGHGFARTYAPRAKNDLKGLDNQNALDI